MKPIGHVTTGLRLSLSPTLFNSVLEKIVKEKNITAGVMLWQLTIDLLANDDDAVIVGNNIKKLNHRMRNLKNIRKRLV